MEATPHFTDPSFESSPRAVRVAQEGGSGGLPASLTSFVGREEEIALASSLLRRPDVRLLTFTGAGGIGKTRLAIELAVQNGADFPDGVLFVSIAPVQDHSMVLTAIASVLGLQELDNVAISDAVASSLGVSRTLLVIDNFEHVLDAAPALTNLISQCPQLKIIVTSRSLLRVEGEHAIPVPPLALPNPTSHLTVDDWLRVPVIRLFIERAEAVDPSLIWTQDEVFQVVEICRHLDGLPLAVELAATRVRHFTLAELRDRLDDRLPLLTGGSRDHPSRLQTMRNAIAWSHDLLSPSVQALFRHAAVFSGGFTLEAIETVSAQLEDRQPGAASGDVAHQLAEPEPLSSIGDRLAILIDASLLLRDFDPVAGTARCRMLETIREYASEQLAKSGEEALTLWAHASYFTNYAEQHEFAELMPEQTHAVEQLIVERDNLRAALTWLETSPDHELFQRLVAALGGFWLAQCNYQEGASWSERALAANGGPATAESAKILVSLGMFEIFLADNQAAEAHLAQGVAACREQGQPYYAALALIGLAGVAIARGDGDASVELLQESQRAASAIPDARIAGIMLGRASINLAVVARASGDLPLAESHVEDALRRFRAEQYSVGTTQALGDLGDLARDRGDWGRALASYKEALAAGTARSSRRIVIEVIESVASVAAQTGHFERSAVLLGAAEGWRDRIGLRYRPPQNWASLELAAKAARSGLTGETFTAAWESGRGLSEEQIIAEVLAMDASPVRSPKSALTARETEILHFLATGMTDPEIADALFISARTVEHHVASICRKLGMRTRTAATSAAIAAGLVNPSDPTPGSPS